MLPVAALLRDRYESNLYAKSIKVPVLILIADKDEVVPMSHAFELERAFARELQTKVFHGYGHNDLQTDSTFYPTISAFID